MKRKAGQREASIVMAELLHTLELSETKEQVAAQLRQSLAHAKALRREAAAVAAQTDARLRLREWQSERLARTHADLLADARYAPAARFFLTDLYGPKDFSERDDEVERILPTMVRVLPLAGLRTVALAVGMDALSEELDAGMVRTLGLRAGAADIDEARYAEAYRRVGNRAGRERQIALVGEIGTALDRLTRKPLVHTALRLMRRPAHAAGLGALQEFLEEGFDAFKHMGEAGEFLTRIGSRETRIMRRLFAGEATPFDLT